MSQRMDWIDSLKGFLALLVVLGHTFLWSGMYYHSNLIQFLYFFVSSFHMSAFFALSGYVCGKKYSVSEGAESFSALYEKRANVLMGGKSNVYLNDRKSNYLRAIERAFNLMVPTVIAMGATFCIVITVGKFPMRQALKASLLWFMWVLIAINIAHPLIPSLIRKKQTVLLLLSGLTFLFGIVFNDLGKFFGYFLLYELGYCLGNKLTAEIEKDFFRLPYGIVACILGSMAISLGYIGAGEPLVLETLYRIPVGIFMTYGVCSICLRCKKSNFLALAGQFSLQIYLFSVVSTLWIKTYTPSAPVWLDLIIFITITCVDYCVPVLLGSRYKNTAVYRMIFRTGTYFFPAQNEKAGR